ncbi:MAG: response regulator transcription factor [Candidatus Competibacterales bacterium]|nr:response regulator transcription factor [Candidatus Competibacterales bacterium]
MARILLVDDHAVVRKGLRSILESADDYFTISEAGTSEQALEQCRAHHFDVVILDINLPGRNGIGMLKRLRKEWPELPILMLSIYPEEQYGLRVLKSGARGYLNKSAAPEKLVDAVRNVLRGRRYFSPELTERLLDDLVGNNHMQDHQALSDREYQVFTMIINGMTPSEIASRLSLSVKTIHTHRARILRTMGLKNNAELMRYAMEHGLLN